MACDTCGKNNSPLVDLRDAYRTDAVKQVCPACEKIINDQLWKVRGVSPKAERGIAIRQAILNRLHRRGPLALSDLAVKLQEPRNVVLGHLNMMVPAGEVERAWPDVYVAKVRKTSVVVHGGAVRKPLPRVVNRCANKQAIANQGGQGSAAPRQTTHARIFGL